MNRLRALVALLATAAAALGGLAVLTPGGRAPAAVTPIVCTSGSAPTLSEVQTSLGWVTRVHYYHQCNLLDGVTGLNGDLTVTGLDDGLRTRAVTMVNKVQLTAASYIDYRLVKGNRYYPTEHLFLFGTFTYGSVPGCGRNGDGVGCQWQGHTYTVQHDQ